MIALFIICVCVNLTMIMCVRLALRARNTRVVVPSYPDKPYAVEGRYVIGGRYGSDPVTGAIGYDRWPFQDERIAAYVVRWLNNGDDHRTLTMVWWRYAQLAAEQAETQTAQTSIRAQPRVHDPECNVCHRYVNRAAARTMTYLRSGRCSDCEVVWHERRLIASYQTPGVILGDGPWPWQTRSSGPM